MADTDGYTRCATCGHEQREHLADDDWCKELAGSCEYMDAMSVDQLCDCRQFIPEMENADVE